jgi:hypothetical protein
MSSREAEKSLLFMPVRESSGKSRLKTAVAAFFAVAIGTFATQGLRAQGDAAVSTPPQFQGDYPFIGSAQCQHSASATCRRKPRSPSQLNADFNNGAASISNVSGASVRVRGDAAAVRLDARRTTIAGVLSALNATFDMSYRSAIVLDEEINGTYAGSLRRVISRVLDGYNYVLKQDGSKLDVIILGKRGERAVPVAVPVDPFRPLRERKRPWLFRTDSRHN